jgi:hypothetical protein
MEALAAGFGGKDGGGDSGGGGFSAPKATNFDYRLNFQVPETQDLNVFNEDYVAKLENMSSGEILDDVIKRNSGGMFT